jgi:hypothetical protein
VMGGRIARRPGQAATRRPRGSGPSRPARAAICSGPASPRRSRTNLTADPHPSPAAIHDGVAQTGAFGDGELATADGLRDAVERLGDIVGRLNVRQVKLHRPVTRCREQAVEDDLSRPMVCCPWLPRPSYRRLPGSPWPALFFTFGIPGRFSLPTTYRLARIFGDSSLSTSGIFGTLPKVI